MIAEIFNIERHGASNKYEPIEKSKITGFAAEHSIPFSTAEKLPEFLIFFQCPICGRRYKSPSSFRRHSKSHGGEQI